MRIATWNINGLRARIDYLGCYLKEVAPDLIGLQELKTPDELFPHEAFAELGYRALVHGQKAWNGVAILAKEAAFQGTEPELLGAGLPGQEEMGARLIGARFGELAFYTAYCPNGKNLKHEDYGKKLAWFDDLIALLKERHALDTEELILCGDFNICPAPLDSWSEAKLKGHIFHTEAERERLASLRGLGLHDLYRELYPEEPGHTWWDYRGGAFHKRQGLRIDHLYGTAKVKAKAESVSLDRTWRKKIGELKASDHTPVWLDMA